MAITLDTLVADEAADRTLLATLGGLITQVVAAVANGSLDQTKAQALHVALTADGTTISSGITAIQAALGSAPPPNPAP